jgi:hypothetical protein
MLAQLKADVTPRATAQRYCVIDEMQAERIRPDSPSSEGVKLDHVTGSAGTRTAELSCATVPLHSVSDVTLGRALVLHA